MKSPLSLLCSPAKRIKSGVSMSIRGSMPISRREFERSTPSISITNLLSLIGSSCLDGLTPRVGSERRILPSRIWECCRQKSKQCYHCQTKRANNIQNRKLLSISSLPRPGLRLGVGWDFLAGICRSKHHDQTSRDHESRLSTCGT